MLNIIELLNGIEYKTDSLIENVNINKIERDSRKVNAGDCYVALGGVKVDVVDYIAESVTNGASIIVASIALGNISSSVPIIYVDNVRETYAIMAANYYDNPARNLTCIGVIGTNGKTTCAGIIAKALNSCQIRTGLIGTLGADILGKKFITNMTTPDSMELQCLLRKMVDEGLSHAVMEVSAHAIALDKTYGIMFKTLLFTNISHDHLDYFGDMERYSNTKINFFNPKNARSCVVNIDDNYARRIVCNCGISIAAYGLCNPSDIFAIDIRPSKRGQKFVVNCFDSIFDLDTGLIGEFNVYNLLGVIGVLDVLGLSKESIRMALDNQTPIEGRFNMIKHDNITYIIDFAHTPEGLKKALTEGRNLARAHKLVAVFGCGGERDKAKRPIMGGIACEIADTVIVTSDNPRGEDRHDIIGDIVSGMDNSKAKVFVCPNRKHALEQAISQVAQGDVVMILGKGAEEYIEEKGNKIPYNDETELRNLLGV